MQLSDLIPASIKTMDLQTAYRHAKSIAVGFVAVWASFITFGGPIIESYAEQVFKKYLIQNPQFLEMQKQIEANGKGQEQLKKELDAMGADLGAKIGAVSGQLSIQNATSLRMERDIDRIVEALLPARRGEIEMPPWPNQVQP